MPLVRLAAFAMVCALLPATLWAQPWMEAYRAGEHAKAAEMLHPIVVAADENPTIGGPAPFEHLARLYARGLGVPADGILACALARRASIASWAAGSPPNMQDWLHHQKRIQDAERFQAELCDPLSESDRRASGKTVSCYGFGLIDQVLSLGPRTVYVTRRGITVDDPDGPIAVILRCPVLVARVRGRSMTPPPDAAPGVRTRHFIEVLAWDRAGGGRYGLAWHVFEVTGKQAALRYADNLSLVHSWPNPALPPDIDTRLTLEMIRSGHVRWRYEDAPPRRGWIMSEETER